MIDKALAVRMQDEPDPYGDSTRIAMLGGHVMSRPTLFGD
jgi:hypothetical protein